MPPILPPARPGITRPAAQKLLADLGVDVARPAILARRGYYRDTMGVPGQNDRNIYDDAIVLVSPSACVSFNANTDPSGRGGKLATLVAGVWRYKIGIHGLSRDKSSQYEALVQAAAVTVRRDNGVTEAGWFGINIHRGGYSTTSSLGCQTIWPTQWDAFIALVKSELHRHAAIEIPYALTEYAA